MRKVVVALLSAAALTAPVLADPAPQPSQGSFGDVIDVRVVNVEAVVTDRRGKLVKGLTPADFRLLVDGKEVPIDFFTEVKEGEAATRPAAQDGGPAPAVPPAPGGEVGTSYLIFIDEASTVASQRNVVLKHLAESLRLGPQDQAAVVAYSGSTLDQLSEWTREAGVLRQVLSRARSRPAQGLRLLARDESAANDAELSERLRKAEEESRQKGGNRTGGQGEDVDREGAVDDGVSSGAVDTERLRASMQIQGAVAAAGAALRGFPPPEGRKVFLLLASGWRLPAPDLEIGDPLEGTSGASQALRPERLFSAVTDTANLLGYTVYPVDVRGLDSASIWNDVRNTGPATKIEFITSKLEQEEHDALLFMAEETGGEAILNSARLTAFDRVEKDTRSFYWLGFTPQWQANGRRHEIKVEVRRSGLKARARESFFDLSQDARSAMRVENLLRFGGGEDLAAIRVRVGELRNAGSGTMELPVTLEIPSTVLTPLPIGGGYEVRARLSMGILDEWGGSRTGIVPLRLSLQSPAGPDSYARYETLLKLRKEAHRLVFFVEDATGGGKAWTEVTVEP